MLPVHWRADADDDLANILSYIASNSSTAAADLLDDIDRAVAGIPNNPYIYRKGRVPDTYEMTVRPNYIVVYQETPTAFEILAVVHARQQYP